ncbi:hypothetical protein Rsub_04707 [Raphidocelis subcapitata]|uniref:Uncharacterized protein n=1 Tax=Raphidocelis subcapitata TaxID=307507 RepID=A0A2V0P2C0_9CHLO|nr:hypothetical protein Rsub_04707 [Raphidocelis subcapitata]|eukprot:GBF91983.1 hypothetical protein Rsub_04707 [Raphidocelis subcapitata]
MSHLEALRDVLHALARPPAPLEQRAASGAPAAPAAAVAAASATDAGATDAPAAGHAVGAAASPADAEPAGAPPAEPPPAVAAHVARVAAEVRRLDGESGAAAALQAYLRQARLEAEAAEAEALARADAEFTPAWRLAGLPSKPSPLRVDPAKAATAALLDPAAAHRELARRLEVAELSPPRVFEYDDDTLEPHHLQATENLKVRAKVAHAARDTRQRAGMATGPRPGAWSTLPPEALEPRLEAAKARQRALALQMSSAQWALEEWIVAAMRQRIAFSRNPRYRDAPRIRGGAGRARAAAGPGSPLAAPPPARGAEAAFAAEPPEVVFSSYEAGGAYSQTLRLRNVSGVTRGLRLLPPASQYFHASLPRRARSL